jgi:hypothetical protein
MEQIGKIKCVYLRALLPMYILFEWIQIQQSQHFASGVVGPVRSNHFFFYWASISAKYENRILISFL